MRSRVRSGPNKNLVGFVVGDVAYAVPIAVVRAIVNPLTLTALPHLDGAIAGVADYRGEVIVAVDLRARFGLAPSTDQSRSKWVLLSLGERIVGLIVDRIIDAFGSGRERIRPAPALGGGEDARGISGVTSFEGTLTFILDVNRFEALTDGISGDLPRLGA